jgi:hypothetical protein
MGMLVIAQQHPRRTEKYLVHIVGGNSGGNAVDVCDCQFAAPSVVLLLRQSQPAKAASNDAQIQPAKRHIQLALALCQPNPIGFSIDNTSVAIGSCVKGLRI